MKENNKDNLKVGLFIDSYFPTIDGVIVVVDNYAKQLASKGNNVFVAAPGKQADNNGLDYQVLRSFQIKSDKKTYGWPLPNLDRKYKKNLKNEKVDIIHLHSPFGIGKSGLKYAKKMGVPVVATMHSQFKQDFMKTTKSKLLTKALLAKIMRVYNSCDEVFVMNEKLKELLYDYGFKGVARLMPNATDMDYPKEPKKLLKFANEKYELDPSQPVFLFVGRLIENKGIFFILESIKHLVNKGLQPKMIYVGDGPEMEKLKAKIKELDLQENVILTGKIMDREHLQSLYLRATLFLFPSVYDTDGLVRKEAGANKTPSLLAKGTLAGNLIKDNDTGFLAEHEPIKYADRIIEILNNKELLDTVSENVYTKDHINWEKAVGNAEKAYREIIINYNKKNK